MMRELGWVEVVKGNRDSSRNIDLRLKPEEKLMALRNELLLSRRSPVGFIGTIFHSGDSAWVDRCSSIIVDL